MHSRFAYGKNDYPIDYSVFICDTKSDIDNLPISYARDFEQRTCSIGSKAYVVETGETYILGPDNTWHVKKSASSSSSGGSSTIDPSMIATTEEAKEFLGIE